MRKRQQLILMMLLLVAGVARGENRRLWYDKPASNWLEALPVGNSHLGAMVYGCDGWMAHHNTDIWRVTGPIDGPTWGMFPTGGAWLSTHLWQHYLFTGDKDFLRQYYPVLRGAAAFLLDYVQRQH